MHTPWTIRLGLFSAAIALSSCSGGDSPPAPPAPPATHTVGGSVTGLVGSGLVLTNSGGNALTVAANGSFTFSSSVAVGGAYSVAVSGQPVSPTQTCVVTQGSGTIAGNDVTNVQVACTTSQYTVGGTVTGLTGSGLVLTNNAGNALGIAAPGNFAFTAPVASGGAYSVAVQTQPSGPPEQCVVNAATGTVTTANVTSVAVTCTPAPYTVSGYVSGLSGSGLTLALNSGTPFAVTRNGYFTAGRAATGNSYSVAIASQPANPAQTCTLSQASGTVGATNVESIRILCPSDPARFAYLTGVGSGFADPLSVYSINAATGVMTVVPGSAVATGGNKQPLILSPSLPFAISVNRVTSGTPASTYQYRVDGVSGLLTPLTGSPFTTLNGTGADSGCVAGLGSSYSVTFTPRGEFAYVTNGGLVGPQNRGVWRFTLDAAGAPSLVAGTHILQCQQPSSVTVDASGRFAYVPAYAEPQPSANTDPAIFAYAIGPADGALTPVGSASIIGALPPFGTVTTDAAGRVALLTDGRTANIWAFLIDPASGALTPVSGSPFVTTSIPRSIAIDPASRFLYVALDNGIAIYSIDFAMGALVPALPVIALPFTGDLQIDPSGKFLYATFESGIVTRAVYGYSINANTGALTVIPGAPFAIGVAVKSVNITVAK